MELVHLPVLGFVRAELIINCIVAVLVLMVPLALAMLVAHGLIVPVGSGYNMPDHLELYANFQYIGQITFGTTLVYVVALSLIKASMLTFFLRVFVTTSLHNAAKALLGFVVLWMVCYLCANIFLCHPISAQWTGIGTCGAYVPMIQSLIATNIVSDLVIMSLPMYSIWSLQTRKTEKLGIMSCFALGLAVVVAATCRLVYISTVLANDNITATLPTIMFLFVLEPNLGILCVSIPMLRPLYAMYRKRIGGSRLKEDTDERTDSRVENNAAWEMEDFYRPDVIKHDTTVTGPGEESTPGDDSGSEKNLTTTTDPNRTKGAIRVETVWTMTRS
ncbi:putative integral membrane protein [Eutypa lata UCREL1]|uniref:Putative integral membrane protein n=1 Tax=Eutypa lata (strain UCR-EL1) TaxID=1287681 RepID=M7SY96_EUTLA|nr:putative integral membrane protein [Eutypa lata UCREL1]